MGRLTATSSRGHITGLQIHGEGWGVGVGVGAMIMGFAAMSVRSDASIKDFILCDKIVERTQDGPSAVDMNTRNAKLDSRYIAPRRLIYYVYANAYNLKESQVGI